MKTAIYVGFSAMKNFGDWWLFDIISKELDGLRVIPLSRQVRRYGVRRQLYKGWAAGIIPSPSVTLLGGGTIIVPNSPDFIRALEVTRGRKYSLGTGAKSIEECERWNLVSADRRQQLISIYDAFDGLGVRGPISKQSLLHLGVKKEINIVGDAMLSLFDPQTRTQVWEEKTVWLNTSNLRDNQGHFWMQTGEDEMSLYSRIIKDCRKRGLTVQIFYCAPEDRELSENIAAAHSVEQIHCVLSPSELDALLRPGCAVIATRLHAMVYTILKGIPTAALIYQDKHLDFLNSIGWTRNLPRLADIPVGQELEHIETMWRDNMQNWATLSKTIQQLNGTRRAFFDSIQK
jgi:hypothetical protein